MNFQGQTMIKIIKYKSNGTIQANKIFSHKSLQPATTFSDQNFLQLFYLFVPIERVAVNNYIYLILLWIGQLLISAFHCPSAE